MELGRGPRCLPIFGHLKGHYSFYFRYNEPPRNILGALGRYDHPFEKKES